MTKIRMISDFWGFWVRRKWFPEKNNHKTLVKFLRFIWTCKTYHNCSVGLQCKWHQYKCWNPKINFHAYVAISPLHNRSINFQEKQLSTPSKMAFPITLTKPLRPKLKKNQIKDWEIEVWKSFSELRTSLTWISWKASSQNFSNFCLGSGRRILFCLLILAQISPKIMSKITEKRLSSDLENYYLFDLSWNSCQFSPITNQSIKEANSGP